MPIFTTFLVFLPGVRHFLLHIYTKVFPNRHFPQKLPKIIGDTRTGPNVKLEENDFCSFYINHYVTCFFSFFMVFLPCLQQKCQKNTKKLQYIKMTSFENSKKWVTPARL